MGGVTFQLCMLKGLVVSTDCSQVLGAHGIHPRGLGEVSDVIAGSFSIIYQRSWEVPADWKLASVSSVFKKGVRGDLGNYRPVSLTSVPGKITEKILPGGIQRPLKDNAVIRHSQRVHKGKVLLN